MSLFRASSSYIGFAVSTVRCDSVRLRVVEDRGGKGNYWVMGESERRDVLGANHTKNLEQASVICSILTNPGPQEVPLMYPMLPIPLLQINSTLPSPVTILWSYWFRLSTGFSLHVWIGGSHLPMYCIWLNTNRTHCDTEVGGITFLWNVDSRAHLYIRQLQKLRPTLKVNNCRNLKKISYEIVGRRQSVSVV